MEENQLQEFGNVQKDSESFGTVPNAAESFRNVRKDSERKETHTLTVREAARLFETAGVARTERSIVNWCQANKQGVTRLDCYFDPNERKYFITPHSVELAIKEELAKATKGDAGQTAESNVPKPSEIENGAQRSDSEGSSDEVRALKQEMLDLKITNRAKDQFIEQLRMERQTYVEQLLKFSHRVGELETKLLQLSSADAKSALETELHPEERDG